MSNATEYASGLRELADWLDAHPDADIYEAKVEIITSTDDKETAKAYAKMMAPCTKDFSGELFDLKRNFGPVVLRAIFWRNAVCEKIVTERVVTEMVPDPSVNVPLVAVKKTVHDVEWICAPVLGEIESVTA